MYIILKRRSRNKMLDGTFIRSLTPKGIKLNDSINVHVYLHKRGPIFRPHFRIGQKLRAVFVKKIISIRSESISFGLVEAIRSYYHTNTVDRQSLRIKCDDKSNQGCRNNPLSHV